MHAALPFGLVMSRLAPLALIALLAAGCGDNDESSSSSPPTTGATTTTATATTSTVSTGPSGTTPIPARPSSKGNRLLLGTRDLYPLLSGSLARYIPNQVTGKSVKVVETAGENSFWAGRNAKQRILVKIYTKGKPSSRVQAGQRADFVGHLAQATPLNASDLGASRKTGAPVLQNQGAYVLVSVGDLKLH
jgi:hypothetical protein